MSQNTDKNIDLLGRAAKDKVTGYTGTIVSVCHDLFGCVQVIIKPPIDKDGKLHDGHWFDVNRVELVGQKRVMRVPEFGSPQTHDKGPASKPSRGAAL